MKKHHCRAAACPRKVDRDVIFCNVHLPQLSSALASTLNGNHELPKVADPDARRAVARGIAAAVAALAKKEGRSTALKQAINSGAVRPSDAPGAQTSGRAPRKFYDGAGDADYVSPDI